VGKAFLEPYGLNHDDSTYTAKGTAGKIHEAITKLPLKVYSYHDEGGARYSVLQVGPGDTGLVTLSSFGDFGPMGAAAAASWKNCSSSNSCRRERE
jgi:hypothetical protein